MYSYLLRLIKVRTSCTRGYIIVLAMFVGSELRMPSQLSSAQSVESRGDETLALPLTLPLTRLVQYPNRHRQGRLTAFLPVPSKTCSSWRSCS